MLKLALRLAAVGIVLWSLAGPSLAQTTPEERGQDLAIRRKAGHYTVTKADEVYMLNNFRFEVSPAGWEALNQANETLIHDMSWWPRSMAEFTKRMGWAEIAAMEDSNNFDGAADAAQGFKDKIIFRLQDDGVKWNQAKAEKFISMAGHVVEFMGDSEGFVPTSGRFLVTLIYTPKVKDIVVTCNKSDGSFVIKAPSELEPVDWIGKMRKGLMYGGKFRT